MQSHALEISALRKTYKGGFEALKGIDLFVEQGDFFALLGPNGAGKSTTIGILATLVNKTSGAVKVHNYDLDRQPSKLKTCLGLVPQEYNFNIFEKVRNIVYQQAGYYGMPLSIAKARGDALLKKLGLWEKRDSVSKSLSGGMKRKLMIVRALVHDPKLLVLDEPTAGVDVETRREMWDFLLELNRSGTTIILTTHYLEEAEQLCKNVAIISNGNIIENTTMKSLLSKMDREEYLLDTLEQVDKSKLAACHLPEGFTLELRETKVLKLAKPKEADFAEIFPALKSCNIQVISIKPTMNRLEEMFVKVTSHKE